MTERQTTPEGHAFQVGNRVAGYRGTTTHTWGMFAGLAIELGGYGDVELVDPYTGRTFWFQPADHAERAHSDEPWPFADVVIQALKAAKDAGWFDVDPTDGN